MEEVKTKPSIVPAATSSIPAPQEAATYVIKGPTGSNLPPPAMVTAVVRQGAGYGEAGPRNNRNLPNLVSMTTQPLESLEEVKTSPVTSPRMQAPLTLAPLASKSKATLQPINLPAPTSMTNKSGNPFESKLSHIPINNAIEEGEFESAKTLMPGTSGEVNEINALMGQDKSMADLATSLQSPGGPTNRSKYNAAEME